MDGRVGLGLEERERWVVERRRREKRWSKSEGMAIDAVSCVVEGRKKFMKNNYGTLFIWGIPFWDPKF